VQRFTRDVLTGARAGFYDAMVAEVPIESASVIVAPDGALVGPLNARLLSPPLGAAHHRFNDAIVRENCLPVRIREFVVLTVAHETRSAYVWSAHRRIALTRGVTEAEIGAIEQSSTAGSMSEQERAATSCALTLIRTDDLDDAQFAAAVAALGEQAVFEIVLMVGSYRLLALQARVYRVGPVPA
jgi:alkylhydroperoxidase family enzyme